ncbi:MAG: hypothetical protein IJ055_00655 [Oscillospiraceae bacterium]|nr:hypothetical protein [Oscillospiraceae bacterium]
MDMQTVASLFTLFSGQQDTQTYGPLLTAAVLEVTQSLRTGADVQDARLCYLAAALANLRYTQLTGAREHMLATYAGTAAVSVDEKGRLGFAQRLAEGYRSLCRELLQDTAFVFLTVGGWGDVQ